MFLFNQKNLKIMISIITPAHNEESTIKQFVQSAITYLKMKKIPGEVIVAQNGSNDETASILSQLKKQYKPLRILSLPQGNKGLALRTALTEAKGEKLITLDTDLWDSKFVDQSVELLEKYDVVVGSKVIAGAKDGRPLLSRELNYLYNFAIKLFFNFKGTETHAKLSFRKDSLLPLIAKCTSDHLIFDTELIIRAEREGLPRIEIPTTAKEIRGRRFSVLDHLVKTAKNFLILGQTLGFSINRGYLILLIALVIGAFLRFFQFSDWFFFSVDEEHYAYMTRMITVNHHFPLIGGPISGTKLYMAPWFLYFNSIWFWIGNNSVLFAGAVFVFLELLAIIFVFKLAKAVFSERAAALAALLYSSSTLMALFDRHYWNITLVPLISILTFYTLYKYHQSNRKWIIVTALALGFGLSTTFSVFVIFLFALASIVVIKKRTLFQDLAKFLGIVSLLHLPLVFFDLRHEFWLLKGVKELLSGNYTSGSGYLPETLLRSLSLFVETLSQSLAISGPVDVSDVTSICDLGVQRLSSFPGIALVIVVLLSIFTFIALQKRSKTLFLILVFAAVNILSILFFRTDAQSRHFLPFLPLFFVLTVL